MLVSQKCQYALRAVFELAKRNDQGPVKIGHIARTQAISQRFLEVILRQLKQGGFVESRRGKEGGYLLAKSPAELSVGDIIRFIQGSVGPTDCVADDTASECPLYGCCVFLPMWQEARDAMERVYDKSTFQHLIEEEMRRKIEYVPCYAI